MSKEPTAKRTMTFRDAVHDYAEKKFGKPFGQLSSTECGRATLECFLKEVVQRLEPGRLPEDEDELFGAIKDGKDDIAADFLFRSDTGQVTLIQSKYLGPKKTLPREVVVDFCDVLVRLHDHAKYQMSSRVREVAQDIDWKEDEFSLLFIAVGKPDANCQAVIDAGPRPIHAVPDLQTRTALELLDEQELTQRLREADVAARGITKKIELPFFHKKGEPPWLLEEGPLDARSFLGVVEARHLIHLWKHNKAALFNVNIRGYVGGTSTNVGIMDTARERPERFFFYNNGLAAVCTAAQVKEDGHTLVCDHFAVLNGAQTVRSLVRAITARGIDSHVQDAIGACRVVIRVTEVDYLGGQERSDFLDEMCRFNNTQNAVRIADFRSNDRAQISLNRHFSELSLRGKRYHYKNKREEQKSNCYGIALDALAKTVHAFEHGPVDMYGGSTSLYTLGPAGRYEAVFGDKDSPIGAERFKEMAGAWFVCQVVKERVKERVQEATEPPESDGPEAKLAFTAQIKSIEGRLVFHAVSLLMQRACAAKGGAWSGEIQWLHRPENTEPGSVAWERIREQTDNAAYVLQEMYASAMRDLDFAHRNWFRQRTTLATLRQKVGALPSRMIAPSVRAK